MKNLVPPIFGPFWSKFAPFWPKINIFYLYLPNALMNFADFWYRILSYDFVLENIGLRLGKNPAPPILGPFWSKFAPFRPKINILAYHLNCSLNFSNFWYRNLSFGLLLENWCLQSRKNLAPPIWGPFWSNLPLFGPKSTFFSCIFQTLRWILLIFCIETYFMVFFEKS